MFKVNKFELTTLNGVKKRLKGILIRNGYFWYRDVNFLKIKTGAFMVVIIW
jgi:hypothetical protein